MKPTHCSTKILLDSGDPRDTERALDLLGFLDGQTTNPSLVAKNPAIQAKIAQGKRFGKDELLAAYREAIQTMSKLIPAGSISIEVYADLATPAETMLAEAQAMNSWIPNAHIKLPILPAGLQTATTLITKGIRVNMTLCFTTSQAAAVHAATRGAQQGDVLLSPFIGRLDDQGERGTDLIANILAIYRAAQSPVEVLAASIRSYEHFLTCLALGVDAITSPLSVLETWAAEGMPTPTTAPTPFPELKPIPLDETLDLSESWEKFSLDHPLTTKGIERFCSDWNNLLS